MKTTIDLPDELAERARTLAAAQRTTLRELVIAGLHTEIESRATMGPVDFVFPTVGGHGLAPGLAPELAIERSYGLPA